MFKDDSHGRTRSVYRAASLMFAITLLAPVAGRSDQGGGGGGGGDGSRGLRSLKTEAIPLPAALGDYVADEAAAVRLGKALFWDQQSGGDGMQACASCHFQAGADTRSKNQLNAGANGVFDTFAAGGTYKASNFPRTNDDVSGSQGLVRMDFVKLSGKAADSCKAVDDPAFHKLRRVTGRNTPSAINAIFNFRSFWDGRANNVFNGKNPAGPTDPTAQVLQVIGGVPTPVTIALENASLASQSVGPPNNGTEMSCNGRNFSQLGRKMLGLKPLGAQTVSKTDSVLGALADGKGLKTTYKAMIKAAFKPEWWDSDTQVSGFSVMENNFSLYWGLSVMLYESKLVSDDSRVDRYLDGNTSALTAEELAGMDVFTGKGRCDQCHSGAVLSEASVSAANGDPLSGFINDGVRPAAEDGGDILQPGLGFFKTPTVRNTELNGPYFHNGNKATLMQVVDFYNRGGDFPDANTDSDVRVLNLTDAEKHALVAFMLALTDDRVKYERAPFDHPSLTVNNGPKLAAVGAAGNSAALKRFISVDPFSH